MFTCNTKHTIVLCYFKLQFYQFLSTYFVGRNCNMCSYAIKFHDQKYCITLYRIVGFFEVHKFHEFHGCWSFEKFNPLHYPLQCWLSFWQTHSSKYIRKKTENQPFTEFKYLKKTNYMIYLNKCHGTIRIKKP